MAKKKKNSEVVKPSQVLPQTPKEKLFDELKANFLQFTQTLDAIMLDYVASDGEITEIKAAVETVITEVLETWEKAYPDDTFDTALDMLKRVKEKDKNAIADGELLELCDQDSINDAADLTDFYVVRVPTLCLRERLDELVKAEIYPNYLDQEAFIGL